jgi:polyhydroxybutyrate depolymerase
MKTKMLLFTVIIICFASQISYGQDFQFMWDDSMRTYVVHEPDLEPNPDGYPLIVGLHGAGSNGAQLIATAFLARKANQEKFIIAAPNGLVYNFVSWWNSGDGYEEICNGTDDVGFISALIDTMIKNYNIDPTRVYLMAHSSGSMMAYRVAAEYSSKVAAIATNSGQMVYENEYFNPEFPMPIIHFHGTEDPICPYEGRGDSIITIPHADSVMAMWREANNCTSIPDTIFNQNGIIGQKWISADGDGDIVLYITEGWGHGWQRIGEAGIDATGVMWDFMKLQKKDSATNVEGDDTHSIPENFKLFQNYPNPFNPSTMIKYQLTKSSKITLKIYNLAGQEMETLVNGFQQAGEYEITWQPKGLSSGLYFYRVQTRQFSETRKLILQK